MTLEILISSNGIIDGEMDQIGMSSVEQMQIGFPVRVVILTL